MSNSVVILSPLWADKGDVHQTQEQMIGRCMCDPVKKKVDPAKRKIDHVVPKVDVQCERNKISRATNTINEADTQPEVLQQAQTQQQAQQPQQPRPCLVDSRKNWSKTIDLGHSNSCLRQYGSNRSNRSATTLRSLETSSRGSKTRFANLNDSHSEELLDDEKLPGGPGLNERELWSLHRAVPGLRRHDPRTSTIRQHYYPEGGWGWLVVGAAFLVQVLTTGLQFAYGVLATQVVRKFGQPMTMEAVWIGVLQLSGSWLFSPLVVALCRRKSTRLAAVLGGLLLALTTLFTSFANQLHQVFLSYGALMAVAVALVRETASLMVGQYFKRRRDFVEIVVQIGSGIGVILFAVFFKEALSQLGWRLGLQAATGLLFSAFFLGTFYRSASLYHPQRRAILHLKTQRKKVKVKGKPSNDRPPYFDFSVLQHRNLQTIMLSSAFTAVGAYTPLFYLALEGESHGLDSSDLLLIHTFLGLSMAGGCVITGLIVIRPSPQCLISLQYLCQATLFGIGISLLALATVSSYQGYVLFVWLYGFCLGGYQYAIHQYTLDRIRVRQFARGWAFVLAIRALPLLIGVPVTGYINQSTPRAGYYFSFAFTMTGSLVLFISKWFKGVPGSLVNDGRDTPTFHRAVSETTSQSKSSKTKDHNSVRTVHQDVCTCNHQNGGPPSNNKVTFPRFKLPTPWMKDKTVDFADDDEEAVVAAGRNINMVNCLSEEALVDCDYIQEWDNEFWPPPQYEGCVVCNNCADCRIPAIGNQDAHLTANKIAIPRFDQITPLPRMFQKSRRSVREMSLSDPEHLQDIGIGDYPHDIPRLPAKLLRRQHTWHDISALTREVDVIEQITTSV